MKKRLFIGQYRLCDLVTMLSTLSASIGIILCLNGHTNIPFLLLFVCCICDSFDGIIARMRKNTEFETSYGVELDSLSDMIAFGVFPAVLALTTVKYSIINYIAPLYILAGLIRLTYFNALNINKKAEKGYFRGVPITTISLIYPLYYFIKINNLTLYSIFTIVSISLLGVLFITNIRVKKPNMEKILKLNKEESSKKKLYCFSDIFNLNFRFIF